MGIIGWFSEKNTFCRNSCLVRDFQRQPCLLSFYAIQKYSWTGAPKSYNGLIHDKIYLKLPVLDHTGLPSGIFTVIADRRMALDKELR